MKTQQYIHWYYYIPNDTTSLASEVFIHFFISYFYSSFHCFLLIIMEYFSLFINIVPN